MGSEFKGKGLSRMEGTSWHVGYILKKENDPRRHKSRCKYHREDGTCSYKLHKCDSSSHCKYYVDKTLEKEKVAYRKKRAEERASAQSKVFAQPSRNNSIHQRNVVEQHDTVILRDVDTNGEFEITLDRTPDSAPLLHTSCKGKSVGDKVSVNNFTYIVLQIEKPNGKKYNFAYLNRNKKRS